MKFEGPKQEVSNLDRSTEKHSFELWDKCFAEAEARNFAPAIERNEKGEILSPNGMVSRLPNEDFVKVSRTPTFKAWFGDWVNDPKNSSKVVYEDTGEPMVVYHGTASDIPITTGLLPSEISAKHGEKRIYFSAQKDIAAKYAEMKGARFSAFLNFKKPEIRHTYNSRDLLKTIDIAINDGLITQTYRSDLEMAHLYFIAMDEITVMHLLSDIE